MTAVEAESRSTRRRVRKSYVIVGAAVVLGALVLATYAISWVRDDLDSSREQTTAYLTAALAHDPVAARDHACQPVRSEFERDPAAAAQALADADDALGDVASFSLNRGDRR